MEREARKAMKEALKGKQDPVVLTYEGGAFDTEVIPGKYAKNKDGSWNRYNPIEPEKTETKPIEVYNLWGVELPKGKPVAVDSQDLLKKGIAFKAENLEFITVEKGEPKKKPGRPKKDAAEG